MRPTVDVLKYLQDATLSGAPGCAAASASAAELFIDKLKGCSGAMNWYLSYLVDDLGSNRPGSAAGTGYL